jgi:hypothetical protein
VGIGAQKSGTSWWNALLHAHPDVRRASGQPKELHFFDGLWERPWTEADCDRYARYFPRPAGAVVGEWTPAYMIDFWTPELLARAAPDARLLVLLRDPIERFRSGLAHTEAASGRGPTHRDVAGAFQRGLYAQQVRRVLEATPRDRVLILQYEACRGDGAGQLSRTFRFLGLPDVALDPGRIGREVNPTTSRKLDLSPTMHGALIDAYAVDIEQLRSLVPELDLTLWPTARGAGLG